MIIGEARSECSIAISKQTNHTLVPQISYASTSPFLSDKIKFPFFFRICPSDVYQAKALGELVKIHEWKKMGTIAIKDEYSRELVRLTEKILTKENIVLGAQERMKHGDYKDVANHLKEVSC